VRYRYTEPNGTVVEIPTLAVADMSGHMSDLAALQRETKMKLAEINELAQLEGPAAAMSIFLSFRATGRMISYARAEQLLDEVEPIPEAGELPGDVEEEAAEDPTSAPTASDRGDELPAAASAPEASPL
jgi:hypothetical protein